MEDKTGGGIVRRKRQFRIYSTITASFILIIGYVYFYVSRWENRIYPNSYIENIDVSGMAADQAKSAVEVYKREKDKKKISAADGDKIYTASLQELTKKEDVDKLINTAMKYGKKYGVFKKFGMLSINSPKLYSLKAQYDEKAVKSFIENIKNDINKPPRNAYIGEIVNGKPVIVKEVNGREVLEKQLFEDIIRNMKYGTEDIKVQIKVSEIKPAVSQDMIKSIETQVSSFTTNYQVSAAGRAENIALAASKINGAIILPGEEFSFNKMTGERTVENGFKGAPVIINDKLVDGVAGGVCQVSSTLYNAVIKLGIKPTQRRNHTLAPAYVQLGFDATVSESIDYRFRNTLSYPLYIQGKAQGGRLTFNIYSHPSLKEMKYVLVNEVVEVIEPQIIYNAVNTIPSGSIEKIQEPIRGYKVRVYLLGYKNGKEISREVIYNDNYNKVDEIFNVGI